MISIAPTVLAYRNRVLPSIYRTAYCNMPALSCLGRHMLPRRCLSQPLVSDGHVFVGARSSSCLLSFLTYLQYCCMYFFPTFSFLLELFTLFYTSFAFSFLLVFSLSLFFVVFVVSFFQLDFYVLSVRRNSCFSFFFCFFFFFYLTKNCKIRQL